MKKHLLFLGMLLLFILSSFTVSANGLPYQTYTYSPSRHQLVPTQDAYLPLSISYALGDYSLSSPQDLTIDDDDNVYIADYGNARVIKYSLKSDQVTLIGEGVLSKPGGVHVGKDGSLYVADFGTKKAYKFVLDTDTDTYSLQTTYEKPVDSPYFSDTDAFDPVKVVTDNGDNVYVLLSGNINGMAEYENGGAFFGFFGGNRIPNTWTNVLKYILFDETQRREWFQMIPSPVSNVAVDHNGLILTTTKGVDGYLKLNIANYVYNQSVWGFDNTEDLFVGPYNTIFAVSADGYLIEYDPEGSVLFVFSGPDQYNQKGLFKAPTGIAVDSKNNIYVVDKTTNALQVFVPTQFADYVHSAIELYQQGKYEESLDPWRQVLGMNSLFDLANKGIGDAYFAEADYPSALVYYEIARDQQGYSQAFWEVRNNFLLTSASAIIIVLGLLVLVTIADSIFKFMKYVKRPLVTLGAKLSQYRIYREMIFPFHIITHPVDGYYGIKREKKGSNLTATIYLVLFFASYLIWIYGTSFLFNDRIPSEINLFEQALTVFVPFILFVVANYLVCSIREGEGKFSDVFQASAYTLLPMIITLPVVTLVSRGLTYNESFIYYTLLYAGIAMTVIYFIIMVKEIHYYDMKPTIGNILITLFTAVMILAVIFIVFLLLSEVWRLLSDIVRELVNRG